MVSGEMRNLSFQSIWSLKTQKQRESYKKYEIRESLK